MTLNFLYKRLLIYLLTFVVITALDFTNDNIYSVGKKGGPLNPGYTPISASYYASGWSLHCLEMAALASEATNIGGRLSQQTMID